MKFHTKPWKHQLEAINYLMPREFGALYTDMGSGKTKIMIDLIVNKGFKKIIIVCPKKVCRVWSKEFTKHAPESNICVLDVSNISGDKRVNHVENNSPKTKIGQQVIVVNYDSIWREPFKKYLLEKYKADCVICDESHRIKSPASKCSKFLQLLGKRTKHRFLMTGTPLAQSPLDIYAQYRFLAPEVFGTNFNNFKYEYGNWIQIPGGITIPDKREPYKNLDKLHEKMFSCAFKTDSELELPETQDILVEFNLSPQAEKYYKELQKEGCMELEQGTVEATNVLTIVTRLQQLTSGYLPVEKDGKNTVMEIDSSRKETMKELLENLPENESIVVFAKYKKDIKNIRSIVKEIGRKSSELSGDKDTLQNWLDGKTTVLVVQISSGAEGIDLTKARYCIYYTLTHSLSRYLQSRKRVHRPGQTRPVIYYTIVGLIKKGKTIDEQIVESLKNNQDLIDYIMSNKEI